MSRPRNLFDLPNEVLVEVLHNLRNLSPYADVLAARLTCSLLCVGTGETVEVLLVKRVQPLITAPRKLVPPVASVAELSVTSYEYDTLEPDPALLRIGLKSGSWTGSILRLGFLLPCVRVEIS